MPTLYANPGNVLRMTLVEGDFTELKEISMEKAINDIHTLIMNHDSFTILSNIIESKISDEIQRQIVISWEGGDGRDYEVNYEWLVKSSTV